VKGENRDPGGVFGTLRKQMIFVPGDAVGKKGEDMSSEFFVSEVFFEVVVHHAAGEFRDGESLFLYCGVESLSLVC